MCNARVKRRTSHEPNRLQMRKNLCSPSLSFISIQFGSCEVRRLTPALNVYTNCDIGSFQVLDEPLSCKVTAFCLNYQLFWVFGLSNWIRMSAPLQIVSFNFLG